MLSTLGFGDRKSVVSGESVDLGGQAVAMRETDEEHSTAEVSGGLGLLVFFASRRRHTSSTREWISAVCSSVFLSPQQKGYAIHARLEFRRVLFASVSAALGSLFVSAAAFTPLLMLSTLGF